MLSKRFSFLFNPTGEFDLGNGLRAMFAVSIPIILGNLLGRPKDGVEVELFTFFLLLADNIDGLYLSRLRTLFFTTLGMALVLVVGTIVSKYIALTLLVTFLGLFIAGYLTVYGDNGAAAGLVIGLTMLFAITMPSGTINLGIERAILALLSGLWVCSFFLWIWPFQPNQPIRKLVQKNFKAITDYLVSLQDKSQDSQSIYSDYCKLLSQARLAIAYFKKDSLLKNEINYWKSLGGNHSKKI